MRTGLRKKKGREGKCEKIGTVNLVQITQVTSHQITQ